MNDERIHAAVHWWRKFALVFFFTSGLLYWFIQLVEWLE